MGYLIIIMMLGSFIAMMVFVPRWINNHSGKYWSGEREPWRAQVDNDFRGTMISLAVLLVASLLLLYY